MHTNLTTRSRKNFFMTLLSAIVLIFFSLGTGPFLAHAQGERTPPPRSLTTVTTVMETTPQKEGLYRVKTLTLSDGTFVTEHTINGPAVPPSDFKAERQAVDLAAASATIISGVPTYGSGGACSSTAGAIDLGFQDRGNFPNLYRGPTAGGVMPLVPVWGTRSDGFNLLENNPLSASQNGLDGKQGPGHVDDYWYRVGFLTPEPYIVAGRQEHVADSLGDFMRTSQFSADNVDGDTKFYNICLASPTAPGESAACSVSLRPFTALLAEVKNLPDGTAGIRRFYQERGYAVAEAYNQPTDNVVAGGFSLAQFKAEINAGWPVLLHLGGQSNTPGHSVVGVGYDTASNQIYIHDGWDYNMHTMPWGGSYANMPMLMVSIIHPIPPAHPGDYTISGYVGVPNATITYPGGSAKADYDGFYSISVPPGWSGTVTPSKPGYTFQPQSKQYSNVPDYQTKQSYTANPIQGSNLMQDPSFESSSPSWIGFSTNFGTPLCDATCGDGARTGSIWAWFGGTTNNETATLSQTVTIPRGSAASLDFYLWLGEAGAGSDTADVFTVKVDGTTVFSANATQLIPYGAYAPVRVDVTAYANGAQHTITFGSVTTGQDVSFHLDDVSLASTPISPRTISGNAGIAGATLNYFDGTAKSTLADGSGNYSLSVPLGWSGTVTPTKAGYKFTPTNRPYSNVQNNLTTQNYTAQVDLAGPDTTGVFRPSNGALYLKNKNETGFADVQINYGLGGDYPVVGDWDGNGTVTIGIYRNGSFYLRNSNTIGFADIVFPFGAPGDQPVAGDWDGDGDDTIGVYRNGAFFLRNSNDAGAPDMTFGLGVPGDVGIAGDWNGDGADTTGVFRPSNGALYLKNTNATGFADIQINYGLSGDKPVTGDWNDDGVDTIGIYRDGAFYLRNSNTIGFADIVFALGIPGDHPIAGNWDALP